MPRPERTRGAASVAVLVVASIALIATSPAMPTAELPLGGGGSVELTDEAPVAVVPITVRASKEGLWPSGPEISLNDAWVFFGIDMPGVARHTGAPGPVRLSLVPTSFDVGADPAIEDGQLYLDRLCPQAQDCELTLDLVLEWLVPEPGGTLATGWWADGRILLNGTEVLPAGVTAGVAAEKPEVRNIPVLSDQVAEETITLSAERPLVVRHLTLEADAAALPAEVEYPLEGLAIVRLAAEEQAEGSVYGERTVTYRLVPDPGTPAGRPMDIFDGSLTQFDPFVGCIPNEPCRRGYTLRVELTSSDPAATVDVTWSADARLLYHEGPGPGPGASVTLEQDGAWEIGPDAPALMATASGRMELPTDRGGTTILHPVTVTANAAALPRTDPTGGPAYAVATITIRAGVDGELGETERTPFIATVDLRTDDEPNVSYPHVVAGEETRVAIFPLRGCDLDQPCEAEIVIGGGISANSLNAVAGRSPWIEWQVDVRVMYASLDDVPAGARLEVVSGQLD